MFPQLLLLLECNFNKTRDNEKYLDSTFCRNTSKETVKKLGSNKQLQGTVRCETKGKEIWLEHALVFSVKTVKTTKKQAEKKKK